MPGLIYVGKAWLPGIPARDLRADEVERYGRERLLASGLYAEPTERGASDDRAAAYDAVAEVQELVDGTDEEE